MTDLRLATACPKWCTEDHTVQQGEDLNYHAGDTWELSLPDGRVAMEVTLVHEPDDERPRIAVTTGPLTFLLDQVALLDDDQAAQLEAQLLTLAQKIRRGRSMGAGR